MVVLASYSILKPSGEINNNLYILVQIGYFERILISSSYSLNWLPYYKSYLFITRFIPPDLS